MNMYSFFQRLFTRYPVKTRRALEFIPGLTSWTLILSPIWASFLIPNILVYFILLFDVYWLYRSFSLAIMAWIASNKIRRAENENWLEKVQSLEHFNIISHVIIIPNFKERYEKLRHTLTAITQQTFPTKRLYIVLAMEVRESDAKEKAEKLISEFKQHFGDIIATFHPDIPGEVKGKSSNESFGARQAYKLLVETHKIDLDFSTISSVDADSIFDPQYFSYLSYKFLNDPKRNQK